MGAGAHRYDFDGRDQEGRSLPSGIYLVRLRYGQECVNKLITLVR